MKIKTTMKYHLTPVRIAIIKSLQTINAGKGVEKREHSCNVAAAVAKSLQSCLTLWDPIDGSPPGYTVPMVLQARTLECVAISFSPSV